MTSPSSTGLLASHSDIRSPQQGWDVRTERRPQTARPHMRKFEVAYLTPQLQNRTLVQFAPAAPLFEMPFLALARGTLISTTCGPIAIEDLQPGMDVSTSDGAQTILWKGVTTIVPHAPGQTEQACTLARMPAGSLGQLRPQHDLLLGYAARLWRPNQRRMVPAWDFIDGESAFTVRPQGPVRLFHIALRQHSRIIANGMEVESFHPGALSTMPIRRDVKSLYLALFPHIRCLSEFGPLRFDRDKTPTSGN